jgi:alginate O-acetyltransferase complex protein AlgI
MVFSSSVFLFLFLPVVLAGHALAGPRMRNGVLLAASLFFYAWGEVFYVLVMLGSILANYGFGLALARWRAPRQARRIVGSAVALNLGMLIWFKYANFLADNLSALLVACGGSPVSLGPIHLPIGISFFTFQAMTYVVDVYRRQAEPQRNPIHVALYIALFPQLIAGPIVRYADVARQLVRRAVTLDRFASGVSRFVVGLGKKMLIANVVSEQVDLIFALPASEWTAGLAWLGAGYYALQIYFDFSGYSDMAIGLGRMFGFEFLENFNYPYIARSIQDFWRRWHISLSTWFRDYLYIPLGGSRGGRGRTYLNLLIVFLLCGLWHGARWNFLVWGLFHGAFLVVERAIGPRSPHPGLRPFGHLYALLAVVIGWVLFRADSLAQALAFLRAMAGFGEGDGQGVYARMFITHEAMVVALAGVVAATPVVPWLKSCVAERWAGGSPASGWRRLAIAGWDMAHVLAVAGLLLGAGMKLAAGTYNPFIYFRF